MRFIVAFGLLFALPVSDAAPALPLPGAMPTEPCSVRIVGRDTLRVGEHPVYMQPLVVDRDSRGEILLAGRYTHLFERKAEGGWSPLKQDSVFGVVLSAAGVGRAVRAPIPAHRIDHVRASARPEGGWDVVFAELPDTAGEVNPLGIRLWHGVLKGLNLESLQPLPLPAGYRVQSVGHSELVRTRDGLAWAVAVKPQNRLGTVLLLRQGGGKWRSDPPLAPTALYAALASLDSGSLLLALVSGHRSLPGRGNSLYLYASEPQWRMVRMVVSGAEEEVHDPSLTVSDEVLLAWDGIPQQPDATGHRHARVLPRPLASADGRAPVTLDSANAATSPRRPVLEAHGGTIWVTAHAAERQISELRFVHTDGVRSAVLGSVPYPFYMPTVEAVATGPADMLLVGGDYDAELRTVWLLLYSARVECIEGSVEA